MYWGGFGYNGTTDLVEIKPRSDSLDYQEVLEAHLVKRGAKLGDRGWIFQQDNASIHSSQSTRNWLARKKIRVLDWPSKSPDLNPVENLWGILVRQVYGHGKQYSSVAELKAAIQRAWPNISLETLRTLINSMKNRIFQVILGQGAMTKY